MHIGFPVRKRHYLSRLRAGLRNLRDSGALDSEEELREAQLSRRRLEGTLDAATYQASMTQLARDAAPLPGASPGRRPGKMPQIGTATPPRPPEAT